jgi:hypothetical protein
MTVFNYGRGIIIPAKGAKKTGTDTSCRLAAFLPPGVLSDLRAGRRVMIKIKGKWVTSAIVSMEPDTLSPAQVKQLYFLNTELASLPRQNAVILVIRPDNDLPGLGWDRQARQMLSIRVDGGSRRLVSFLPLVGKWLSK